MTLKITSLPPVAADERITYGPDESQFYDAWIPHDRPVRGAAVMIHGGFWRARYDLTHASHLCAALAKSGFAVANLEYRRVGNPGGGWPGSYRDILAGFDAATARLGQTPVVLGHSAGGHLALRLAVDRRMMRGVVALAPVASLQMGYEQNLSDGAVAKFLGGTPDAIPEVYADACPSLHPSTAKRVLVHGTEDDVVPISLSRKFVDERRSDAGEARLVEVEGAGHFDLIDPKSTTFATVLTTVVEMADSG
jgi:acetyl esterase/lipase